MDLDLVSGASAEIRHHSSSVGRNTLHLCFKAKYCHNIFEDNQVEKRCAEIFEEAAGDRRWVLREVGFDKDHVHITIDAGTNGPMDVAKTLKGRSGRKLLMEFPYLKEIYFWGSGPWSRAYYFDGIGERTVTEMEEYVRDQGKPKTRAISRGQTTLRDFAC
jgi:putative transposase